jgi:hypothetical protein
VCVDWCDALGFCAFVGKRLCGGMGGGPITVQNANDASQDEWYNACSEGGVQLYPYGNTYQPTACNGLSSSVGPSNVSAYRLHRQAHARLQFERPRAVHGCQQRGRVPLLRGSELTHSTVTVFARLRG